MTISLVLVVTLLLAHYIGDFQMQSDEMALGKSTSLFWLGFHVLVYTVTLCCCLWILSLCGIVPDSGPAVNGFILVNAAAHFLQDAVTSRLNTRNFFMTPVDCCKGVYVFNSKRHVFFCGIGVDQMLHYVTLFVTAAWWLQ